MSFRIFDEVTADCLQEDDLILIVDASTDENVYVIVDEISDEALEIKVIAHNIDDTDSKFEITLDPDDRVELYMESDEED